jgi:hypothetical protein
VNHVLGVFTKFLLQHGTNRLGITARVPVERAELGRFLRHDRRHFGVGLADAHRDQCHGQSVEDHHALHHGPAELGILGTDPQARQDATADQQQSDDREQAERQDDRGPGDRQWQIEDGIGHFMLLGAAPTAPES